MKPVVTPASERLIIEGGHPLKGVLPVGGSKNTVLMLMTAGLLGEGRSMIENVPVLNDVWTLSDTFRGMGCPVEYAPDQDPTTPETLVVDASTITETAPPDDLIQALRASFYIFGVLVGRCGEARVAVPGGDAWGVRPVNLHIEGLRALGAEIEVDGHQVVARVPGGRLKGGHYRMEPSSVGATVNILLGAVLAIGESVIENAAREPDVVVFGEMLRAMGAQIDGLGTDTLTIQGVETLNPVQFRNAPDRIEAGTHMIMAALAGDRGRPMRIATCEPRHLGQGFLQAFEQTGIPFKLGPNFVEVTPTDHIRAVDVTTGAFPGFPTDLQAQWMVLMTQADRPSRLTDNIYRDRFQHVPELQKMGANITVGDGFADIKPSTFHGAEVTAADVRAGVALVLAGLIAEGSTSVAGLHHLDRGYERLEHKLKAVGAHVGRHRFKPVQ